MIPRWWRRRRAAPLRVDVVGSRTGRLRDALVEGSVEARSVRAADVDPRVDAVVITDGGARPARLPRGRLRIGWVEPADASAWSVDLLEDVDALLVADERDAAALRPHAVAAPRVRGADVARDLRDAVDDHRARPSVAIVSGVSNLGMRQRWGDHHFAVATAKALRRAGWSSRVLCQGELADHDLAVHDAVLLLAGKVELAPVPGVTTVGWVISHPELVDPVELGRLDAAFVASDRFARRLRARDVDVEALHQCTDPERFAPTPGGPAHELLFVGNSRGVRRAILDDLPGGHDLAVYGYGWQPGLLDPAHLRGDHVPNDELPAYYSSASIVLNDHWEAMRELAFPSNRLYDASACGAAVVSDHVEGLDELFDGGVSTYRDRDDLAALLRDLLEDAGRRRALGAAARASVLDRHTFDHRVAHLLPALSGR